MATRASRDALVTATSSATTVASRRAWVWCRDKGRVLVVFVWGPPWRPSFAAAQNGMLGQHQESNDACTTLLFEGSKQP